MTPTQALRQAKANKARKAAAVSFYRYFEEPMVLGAPLRYFRPMTWWEANIRNGGPLMDEVAFQSHPMTPEEQQRAIGSQRAGKDWMQ